MDTTSISELPNVNPANNITMTQFEKEPQNLGQIPSDMQTYQPIPLAQDQGPIPGSMPTQMQQTENAANINSVLDRARETGSLSLPSRDIPMDSSKILQDKEALPDYIPEAKKEDYIDELVDIEELQERRRKERNKDDSLEELYRELQVPIFIGILFFIFSLPVTTKLFHKYFTFGHTESGSLNLQGYLVKSFLFASIYYLMNVIMTKLSNI